MDSTSNRGSTGQLSSSGSVGAGMHHSLSTPAGVDGGARTPPATPKKGGKMLAIRVLMLDDMITMFQIQAKAMGRVLFEQVCKQLNLLEADYFGLEYADNNGTKYWLDLQKPISRQLGLSLVDPLLSFCVKFYTPDPGQLEEEFTRYLFCLQVKRDLSQGLMQCNDNTAAIMASYIVQSECGDYVAEDYPDHTYLSTYKFVPQQDPEMERKIMENHKKHAGQSPAEADLNLLETARRCELYGVKMHPAKDHENVSLNLAVAHMGIIVFQGYTKINTFSWAKIRKISFKRKRFLIKLHPEGYGYYKDTVEFFFEGRNECKNFWKKCVENHGFFRCSSVKNVSRHKTRVLSRGSSFRYSGKTQKQIVEFVRDNYVKRQTFQRSASFRHSSAHSSASNMHTSTVGNSISAHPLLPLADSNLSVEVSKLSASLGSMGAAVGAPVSPTTKLASRHLGTATSWSSAPDTRPTTLLAQTTNSPSPPLTTQSASPQTSATTSPLHMPYEDRRSTTPFALAVHAAVHRADTGICTTRTHISTVRTPSSHKSEGSLDHPVATNNFTNICPSQTQSQNDLNPHAPKSKPTYAPAPPKRQLWQRSASCRDLYDFSFEDSGQAKRRAKPPKPIEKAVISFEERKLESPITRYDDHHHLLFSNSRDSSLEIHQDIMVPDHKVYSSSYPGTTSYSQESMEDPGNYDLRDSQDDISHDSYELLEKSDDDFSNSGEYKYKKGKPLNTRSCSLDSGNYIPSDSDSEDKRHKCKSSNDVYQDIFTMEDPRDFPREIIPRKSDGSYYRHFKSGSRTSSLESKSDYYESKTSKSSKGSRERSFGSRTSSQESNYDNKKIRKNKSAEHIHKKNEYFESRSSSLESKSEYYDATSKIEDNKFIIYKKDYDRKISFERNYGTHIQKHHDGEFKKETSHVHSISLQNVETEQNLRSNRMLEQNTLPRTQKSHRAHDSKTTHIWPEAVPGVPTEIPEIEWNKQQSGQRSTESESNIFSFDEDKIQSLQESSDLEQSFGVVPNIDNVKPEVKQRKSYKDVFMEIEPRINHEIPLHQPIERTKSDPNSLARQRLSSARRLLLMHQKSIDLTPYESSDEDYLYKQIPSAPPIPKHSHKGMHFEMPTAEFGHFDILKREIQGQKTKFEVPKSQFEILGAKTQQDLINLPPKDDDISYVLHKRHIMNGTAQKDEVEEPIPTPKKPDSESFLFTQNIDLSKVDPVTLEIDKTIAPVQHLSSPKRDITHIDPVLLEALNSKLSQIESDSPTSSKTESLKPIHKVFVMQNQRDIKKIEENVEGEAEVKPQPKETKIKTDIKPKRVIKPRMQPGKKSGKVNKTKVRITSFSSDDESLDSDDVFGSTEATPTRMEFSPPQMRKEMESILKFESERKYLQYTMSSTEVEGSPPTTRKKTEKQCDNGLDPNVQPELRRISERSFSIPSSEDDFNIKTADLQPVFGEMNIVDESNDETLKEELSAIDEERARLNADIEEDIRDLRVPSRTKITEITSPSLRRKGQSPQLFAHARLNLSEGTAFSLLQKQQALESPLPGRRAKSLDTPIIPVNRLPPLNAFSSKDDTVEEEDQTRGTSEDVVSDKSSSEQSAPTKPLPPSPPPVKIEKIIEEEIKPKPKERDQIVPEVPKTKRVPKPTVQTKMYASKQIKPKGVGKALSKEPIKTTIKTKPSKPAKPNLPLPTTTTPTPKKDPIESLTIPSDIKRTKSQEIEGNKRTIPKEKAKSLEKLELRRMSSKERTKSQDDSDTDIVKRKEKQQMLYETAIKQTKTIKSPVKDVLPVFPQVEESVRERHGRLEISINTIEPSVSLEEAIIITKSPKKLDKKITKSLDLNINGDGEAEKIQRLGQSLDLDSKTRDDFKDNEFDFKPETISLMQARDQEDDDKIILEGTSLDVWISGVNGENKLEDIQVIQKSDDFFEEGAAVKPPDLCKSSSDSRSSTERVSLGNSLDIKYIDDSGESSNTVEQDEELIAEMQRASSTVSKFLRRKLESRRKVVPVKDEVVKDDVKSVCPENIVRITSEEESLTEVSDLKCEDIDRNLLAVDHKDALQKLSIERSRSEDTGSWMTVECEEYVGTESSLDYDNALDSPEKQTDAPESSTNLLSTDRISKLDLLKRSSDQSRSSDTGSWTSGEKDGSPGNIKETDESSVSCSMGRAIGLSQTIEMFAMEKGSPDSEAPRSPRSPRICVLGRAFTIDEESVSQSSDEAVDIPNDSTLAAQQTETKKPYPFEEKWSNDSELSQRLHKKITKKMSSGDSIEDSLSDKRKNSRLHSAEKLSTESRNSLDTESSSGSLGLRHKTGDIPKELSSTWKPFPLDSSGSESFDDNLLPPDQDLEKQEYFMCRDPTGDFSNLSDVYYKMEDVTPTRDDTELPEDLANFPANFNYPCLSLSGDILTNYAGPGFLSRTLSRISERSTNSEKSSLEEDSTKASTQSDSLNDESMEVSVSSGSHSNARVSEHDKKTPTNEINVDLKASDKSKPISYERISNMSSSLLQRQISDDRRTSAEMAELSIDDIEIISERGLRLKRQNSDDTIIDEECFEPEYKERSSSQESEEWPLPDIPTQKPLLAMHEVPSSDTSQQTTQVYQAPKTVVPKIFGLRGSLKSQESEQWPSPPSSVADQQPIVENVETYYITPPQEACKVNVDSASTYDNDSNSDNENKTLDISTEKSHTYENVPVEHISESISESLSMGPSGIKITLKKSESQGSNSDEDLNLSNLNDDVFTDALDNSKHELRPQTAMRRSSDDSYQSHLDIKAESPRGSHSSYSEEDCTSSMGTNLEDGTVRYALKPTKCTHSSHSEDTSIALSLSEWSNSTTTVKFQNLSSNSGTTKSSSGLKSDENSLTDIAQSISEWSSSNSTLKAQSVTSIQFQKLSSTTSTGDSTLTDLNWSNSDNPQQQYFANDRPRLGTSIDMDDQKALQSPKNIPSEDLALFSARPDPNKYFTKSTERPIVIPLNVQSDTDSSIEQRTVHVQRYSQARQPRTPMKLSKCSPYYSSSLSSESTPLAGTSPIPINKTATVPLTRSHRKPMSKSISMAKSPPSENDSTSSVESPRSKSERDRRGYRRKRQTQNHRKMKLEREQSTVDEYYYVEHEAGLTEYNEYIRQRNMEEMASNFQYEGVLAEDSPIQYSEVLEEGYIPDGDSQSGSDIYRMEKEEDERFEIAEGFDVTSIPPPLLEDDFETDQSPQI